MRSRRIVVPVLAAVFTVALGAQSAPRGGIGSIQPEPLKEWLSYIASDELQGRQVYTEGAGLAASYIADRLRDWSVKPAGEDGTYFQTVKVLGVKTTSRGTVTVDVAGQTRTFKDGEGITFPKNMGGRQTVTADQIEFVGYGLQIPAANQNDYAKVDPKGKIVVWLGSAGPKTVGQESRRLLGGRSRLAVEKGAIAVIGPRTNFGFGRGGGQGQGQGQTPAGQRAAGQPQSAQPPVGQGATPGGRGQQPTAGGGRGGAQADPGDFTTVQHYDRPVAPAVTAEDEFFDFLFSASDVKYAQLKDLAAKQEPLPQFALKDVKLTFNVDADYAVVNTRFTRNVVGVIEGTDAQLKDTYVAFGAHYDHVGYVQGTPSERQKGPNTEPSDRVFNGADDDGSGTVAMLGIARAFALGPKPKRSLLFVWHAGEEAGLLGSRYNADYPVVPIEKIVAQLNVDMIGRDRDDKDSEENTVYIVGSDRISTELHNLNEDANGSMTSPLKLDYEMNDPADPESIYTRSDHYSYAAKGIPIIFYTTGLHPDYHKLSDSVDRIHFPKMAKIAQLVYATGQRVANLDHTPVRDNKGPRMGKGSSGKIPMTSESTKH